MARPTPPAGSRFDPFADVRVGKSLFQMSPEDWLVPDESSSDDGTPAVAPAGVPQPPALSAPETVHVR